MSLEDAGRHQIIHVSDHPEVDHKWPILGNIRIEHNKNKLTAIEAKPGIYKTSPLGWAIVNKLTHIPYKKNRYARIFSAPNYADIQAVKNMLHYEPNKDYIVYIAIEIRHKI